MTRYEGAMKVQSCVSTIELSVYPKDNQVSKTRDTPSLNDENSHAYIAFLAYPYIHNRC